MTTNMILIMQTTVAFEFAIRVEAIPWTTRPMLLPMIMKAVMISINACDADAGDKLQE